MLLLPLPSPLLFLLRPLLPLHCQQLPLTCPLLRLPISQPLPPLLQLKAVGVSAFWTKFIKGTDNKESMHKRV
jgi:hypothetical protein